MIAIRWRKHWDMSVLYGCYFTKLFQMYQNNTFFDYTQDFRAVIPSVEV